MHNLHFVIRNSEGCTPFMQAVCCRAYNAALTLMDAACTLSKSTDQSADKKQTKPPSDSETLRYQEQLMTMLYPRGSTLDNSPLHVVCCNDTCSFTWTGAEHINQVGLWNYVSTLWGCVGMATAF